LFFLFADAPHGHYELRFDRVRVPASHLLLGEGRGFEMAQGRLGPGRLHHCMRVVGLGERALEQLCARAASRVAFGKPLAQHALVAAAVAESRLDLDAARLAVLRAAHVLDVCGAKRARAEIAQAKIAAPRAVLRVLDRAIQVHGAAGVSQDSFLAYAYAQVRTLRLADGPDEVSPLFWVSLYSAFNNDTK
jgi:acyl-CoA dehydrogenase